MHKNMTCSSNVHTVTPESWRAMRIQRTYIIMLKVNLILKCVTTPFQLQPQPLRQGSCYSVRPKDNRELRLDFSSVLYRSPCRLGRLGMVAYSAQLVRMVIALVALLASLRPLHGFPIFQTPLTNESSNVSCLPQDCACAPPPAQTM